MCVSPPPLKLDISLPSSGSEAVSQKEEEIGTGTETIDWAKEVENEGLIMKKPMSEQKFQSECATYSASYPYAKEETPDWAEALIASIRHGGFFSGCSTGQHSGRQNSDKGFVIKTKNRFDILEQE